MSTLFEHAGGEESLHRLEQMFYDSVLRDPLLQPPFGEGQPQHVGHLTMFTVETFGGPDRFTRELGFQHLIDVHRGLEITEEQRKRFVELYMAALDAAGMPDDEPFRTAVREHVEFGTPRSGPPSVEYPLHQDRPGTYAYRCRSVPVDRCCAA